MYPCQVNEIVVHVICIERNGEHQNPGTLKCLNANPTELKKRSGNDLDIYIGSLFDNGNA